MSEQVIRDTVNIHTQARSQDCIEGGSTWGSGGVRLGVRGFPPAGVEGRGWGAEPRLRKFSIFLLKIDHSETSEFMILGS